MRRSDQSFEEIRPPRVGSLSIALDTASQELISQPPGRRHTHAIATCLECPKCKSKMRVLAFVHDSYEVKKIMKSLGIPDYTAPPPIPDPHLQNDIFFDDIPDYDL